MITKIAAGFGGTLNLIVSAFYIAVVVIVMAVPSYRYVAALGKVSLRIEDHPDKWLFWLLACTVANIVLGIAAALLPMWIGLRAFRRMEF